MPIQWTVLNLGCLSRNKFWGEKPETAYRNAYCTSTLIEAGDEVIVVDPPMAGDEMAALLDSRRGLRLLDVTAVFITHTHGDHTAGLAAFPDARWYMAAGEIATLEGAQAAWREKFIPAQGEIAPGVQVVPLPGHTLTLCGLAFSAAEGRVVVAGDAVMTRDFFLHRTGFHNSADMELVAKTMDKLTETADLVVPGHDNYFYL